MSLKHIHTVDNRKEVGFDEAGRGCLWGPMVAGSVYWPPEQEWTDEHRDILKYLKDSKKVTPKRREILFEKLIKLVPYGIGVVEASDIDLRGATWANTTCFRRALDDLQRKHPDFCGSNIRCLIDGVLPLSQVKEGESYLCCIDGDATYTSIAAASIIAKVWHDRWIQEWCSQTENQETGQRYDLRSCKGYGTAKHREGLVKHGYTSLHRKLYLRKLFPDIIIKRYLFTDDDDA